MIFGSRMWKRKEVTLERREEGEKDSQVEEGVGRF